MILYLIRHGRQDSSACNVNVPLSEEGKRQAALLGERMNRFPVDALYCSDLMRAQETARIAFAGRPDLLEQLQVRSALQEMDFGSLTGHSDAQVKQFYADYYQRQMHSFRKRQKRRLQTSAEPDAFVGEFFVPIEEMAYPDGESGRQVMQRLIPVVREWLESGKKQIAVVCHGGVIRVLLSAFFCGDFARRLQFGTSLENCSITRLHYDGEKQGFYLDTFNDAAHLEAHPELMRGVWKEEIHNE